jgi:hypothetical protein
MLRSLAEASAFSKMAVRLFNIVTNTGTEA